MMDDIRRWADRTLEELRSGRLRGRCRVHDRPACRVFIITGYECMVCGVDSRSTTLDDEVSDGV